MRLGLAACAGSAAPAAANKWPGDTPGPGSAISAKVIGQHCEIDADLASAQSELASKPNVRRNSVGGLPFHELLMRRLAEIYANTHPDPMASTLVQGAGHPAQGSQRDEEPKPLFPDDNDRDHKPNIQARY